MEEIVKIENVSFKYGEEEHFALKKVNLNIRKGEFIAILGHNGSGKSTLAKLINVLLIPAEGNIYVDNMNTTDKKNVWKIRQKAGMVFQNPDNQIVATIVEEDVAFGPENQGLKPEIIRTKVDDSLKAVEMYEYRQHPPHFLSGGQKQRVAVAGVLALDSECIILDEPTAMLDPWGRREVIDIIKKLNREKEKTIILITQFMDEAVVADRICIINDGKIETCGTPKQIFSDISLLKKYGLDVPQVTELSVMLKKEGVDVSENNIFVEELIEELCQLKQKN